MRQSGRGAAGLGRLPEALDAYQQASTWRPADANIHYHRGLILADLDRPEEAIQAQRAALEHNAAHLGAVRALGTLLHRRGEVDEARLVFGNAVFQLGEAEEALALLQYWLRLMPNDPIAQHRLSAWFSGETPSRASDGYVTYLFDRYADCFDEHLVEQLGYQAPAVIGARLADVLGAPAARFDVLDAGCGTGLCQPVLRPHARHLTGVDLSPRMVDKARERGGYDALAVAELTAFLNERPDAYDLIASADTLVYFGALEPVLTAALAPCVRVAGWRSRRNKPRRTSRRTVIFSIKAAVTAIRRTTWNGRWRVLAWNCQRGRTPRCARRTTNR